MRWFGFTLVELIVVITILAILGTIAFTSFNGYTGSARDSARISDLANITTGLEVYLAKAGTVPVPDASSVTINASGTVIGTQGYAGSNVLRNINMTDAKDPSDKKYYTYLVNTDRTKYQVLALLEDPNTNITYEDITPASFLSTPLTRGNIAFLPLVKGLREAVGLWEIDYIDQAFASSYDARIPVTKGSALGVLLGNTGATLNVPIQESYNANSFTGVDVTNFSGSLTLPDGSTTDLKAVFSKTDTLGSGSGWALAILKSSLTSPSGISTRDSSLVAYWDMSTTYNSWWTLYMADLSGNKNHGQSVWLLTPLGGEQGIHSMATRTSSGVAAAMNTTILMQTGSSFTVNITFKPMSYANKPGSKHDGVVWIGYKGSSLYTFPNFIWIGIPENSNILYGRWTYPTTTLTGSTANIGEWHTSSIVYDGTILKIYDNGAFVWTLDATGFITQSSFSFIFNRAVQVNGDSTPAMPYFWDNIVDEARVYNRALSDSEVLNLYNATK